jgi:hypothetical protein
MRRSLSLLANFILGSLTIFQPQDFIPYHRQWRATGQADFHKMLLVNKIQEIITKQDVSKIQDTRNKHQTISKFKIPIPKQFGY